MAAPPIGTATSTVHAGHRWPTSHPTTRPVMEPAKSDAKKKMVTARSPLHLKNAWILTDNEYPRVLNLCTSQNQVPKPKTILRNALVNSMDHLPLTSIYTLYYLKIN